MPPDIKPSNDASKPSNTTADAMSAGAKPTKRCLACGATGVKNRCGGCRQVYFCNLECQKRIWTAHRPTCQLVGATKHANDANTAPPTPTDAAPTVASPPVAATPPVIATMPAPAPTSSTAVTAHASPRKKSVVLVTPPPELALAPPPPASASPTADTNTDTTGSSTPARAAKKKKNKKKKARSNSLHAPASASMLQSKLKSRSQSLSVKKHIMWGDVRAREFTRFPGGGSAVPYDGSWALGLGAPVADVQLGSVLELEELRLQELDARAKELTKSKRSHVSEGETRQFDYKNGIRNPLFGRLSERERKKLFSEAEARHMHELDELHVHSTHKSQRKRSLSSEGAELDDADFACVSSEQLNEFAVIRDSRDDGCGCSCGDLVKKVAKMNQKKLQGFLAARGVKLAANASKVELLARAKAIAMQEKNCSTQQECECARNGVPCHSNVCVGCAGDCWNPNKQYSYEKERVKEYRREQLAKWKASHGPSITVA